ncbi:MAG TPA: histidine kinase [Candidatus Limnocylindrales bacterium]|nr:histidine kinase [Candidatus Limnocylindrales bacterium]
MTLPRPVFFAALALVGGTAFAIGAELQQGGFGNRPPVWLIADFLGGWTFLLTGSIAWIRRPGNSVGPLLIAIGLTWFVGTWGGSDIDWVFHLGRSFQGFYEPLLGVLVLAYPSGRLAGRPERLVAGAWIVEQGCWMVAQLVLLRPLSWYACQTCPDTVEQLIANRELLQRIAPISLALATALAGLVVLLAARRLLVAGPAGRRRLAPVAIAALAVLIGTVGAGAYRLLVHRGLFDDPRVTALYYVVLMLAAVAVLAGLLQDRLARTAVAELVIDLRGGSGAGAPDARRLRDALSRALGDPTLELFLVDRATPERFLTIDGQPVELPQADARRAVTRIGEGDDRVGAIVHDASLLDDPGLVAAVTAAVRLEADNRQLTAEVDRQMAELRASRARIITATDAERRRVERDLHDGAQQRLVALSMELGRLRAAGEEARDPALAAALGGVASELEAAIEELRELARGILPPILTDAGLAAAVESLALRAPLPVDAEVELPGRLPRPIESTLYFVVAEGLANVARHAGATRATIRISLASGTVRAEVADDGRGGAGAERGSGIQGLADRVGALGGTLRVDSLPGHGTTLSAELPLPA